MIGWNANTKLKPSVIEKEKSRNKIYRNQLKIHVYKAINNTLLNIHKS